MEAALLEAYCIHQTPLVLQMSRQGRLQDECQVGRIGGTFEVVKTAILTYPEEEVTITSANGELLSSGEETVLYLGSSDGRLKKVVVMMMR